MFILILSSCGVDPGLDQLRNENKQLLMDNHHLADMIRQRDTVIMNFQNHVIRMQLIAGVDNPDNVFTYTEKILNKIDEKAVIKSHKKHKKR